jgi:hypothetical protein
VRLATVNTPCGEEVGRLSPAEVAVSLAGLSLVAGLTAGAKVAAPVTTSETGG